MTDIGPRFKVGDRVFSHYTMGWGTVTEVQETQEVLSRGEPTGHYDTWYYVTFDDGNKHLMNDGGTYGWDMCRIMPERIAMRYGYGGDPNSPYWRRR